MSPKGRRRRGADQAHRDAASEHEDRSTAPSDVEALAALRTLRAYFGAGATPALFSQSDLPPDVKSADAYKRRHRELRAAGVEGVWMRGKVMACTPEAWAHELPRAPRLTVVEPAKDLDAEVAAALGIRPRST
jgi:hypothetical protein